ncbi:hypothetical protein BC830DRAFT_1059889 [Chytriomyces sp. MP71]|nr:hypothetical protein BC830DRAFT_1059889 [Chytriomyces sp. MP71]
MPSAIAPITGRFANRVLRDVVGSTIVGVASGYAYWELVHVPSMKHFRAYDKKVIAETKGKRTAALQPVTAPAVLTLFS